MRGVIKKHMLYLYSQSQDKCFERTFYLKLTIDEIFIYFDLLAKCFSSITIQNNTKWKQHATTVAGGNDRGRQLNRLDRPQGIFVDTDKTMYIADWWNDRIVQWRHGETKGEIIAGVNGKGNRIDHLNNPTDVILDRKNNALIIADQGNRRVVRWSIQNKTKQEVLVSNIRC